MIYIISHRFTNNFGQLRLLDWLHGTDKGFKASIAYKRDRRLWTLKSMNELYPNDDIKKIQ